ncbi:MAG: SDR family NAD(P)-dependent oxidoreductase [Clostridiales bacterium]|jgi:UDP-glucose 4-epimerase|nr:SDR family NAD(P)-dependent oxidoreductase [Clostridiales bacterium]
MKRVLVTGGAGFIGSHVSEAFHSNGYDVSIIDNLSSGVIDNISSLIGNENFRFFQVDIREFSELEKIFAEVKPDIVCHHAAQKSVPYSVENPLYDAQENIIGLLNILSLVGKYKVKNVLYVSSGGVLSKPITGNEKSRESDFPQLESPYAITKFSGENYVKVYSNEYGYSFSILRYANVYGPRQIPDGECGVIPIFVNNILNNSPSVLMTYSDMPRGCTRDYVYISDIVSANLLLAEKPVNCAVNIGSGKEEAILDIYEAIQKVFDSNLPISIVGPRAGDVKRSVLDSSLIKGLIGWTPKIDILKGLTLLKESYN